MTPFASRLELAQLHGCICCCILSVLGSRLLHCNLGCFCSGSETHIDCSSQAGVGAAKTIMMTMIPVDYHTCFIAISPHAKILYANESMASLLGRKVTEISGKMSLPQLMTIPCQQLHQNFFKVGTLLTACGLHACAAAQLVAESTIKSPSSSSAVMLCAGLLRLILSHAALDFP